ncbi:sphingomyelin synthase-related protein 1 [Protopterus annectens]|uniref:sphingomyelin synthase-related protein 1 n=1 Tax=Protopterus annectens TaxID=7888 RepID=UPI001CFBA044|nr:sphingomyelin synthase-related protein 1 [Protopterus annectens]
MRYIVGASQSGYKTMSGNQLSIRRWTTKQVAKWLKEEGFCEYVEPLCNRHRLDGISLLTLTEYDLRSPPLELKVLGDIKRLMLSIRKLQKQHSDILEELGYTSDNWNAGIGVHGNPAVQSTDWLCNGDPSRDCDSPRTELTVEQHQYQYTNGKHKHYTRRLDPEYWKTVLSCIYVFIVFGNADYQIPGQKNNSQCHKFSPFDSSSFGVSVSGHNFSSPSKISYKNSSMDVSNSMVNCLSTTRPNVPRIPWAFAMAEVCGVTLCNIWLLVLLLHKHRSILLRRLCSLMGTVFLLRCVTMFVTSLSVPGHHLQCSGKLYGDVWEKLRRAITIWTGFGMALTGVHTCGDYMFSGHTVVLTMLNFFVTEYTPRSWNFLHTLSWVLNLFGVFFILAAHEHYSIDVFIAFYITTRLFLYYHTLANTRAYQQSRRARIWFPMFSFFECNVNGPVPNEYCWPFSKPALMKKFIG